MIKKGILCCLGTLIILAQSCSFVVEEHIVGPYYLIGVDSNHPLTLSYELNGGDYIGRVPDLIMIGFNDTLLIGKSNKDTATPYYIIDMRKDHAYAKEEEYLLAKVRESQFETVWRHKLNIQMKPVN